MRWSVRCIHTAALCVASTFLGLGVACSGSPLPDDATDEARDLAGVLREGFDAPARVWPQDAAAVGASGPGDVLVFAASGLGEPPSPDPALRGRLRAHVEEGGHLVLLGTATVLAHDLGFESCRPQVELFRWGDDARTSIGEELHGVELWHSRPPAPQGGPTPEADRLRADRVDVARKTAVRLLAELAREPEPDGQQGEGAGDGPCWLAGGSGPAMMVASWPSLGDESILQGHPLLLHVTRRDGAVRGSGRAVAGAWFGVERERVKRPGSERATEVQGNVLALGVLPAAGAEDPVGRNARRFLQAMVDVVASTDRTPATARRVTLFVHDGEPLFPERPGVVDVPLAQRDPAGATGLAGWGWEASIAYQRSGRRVLHPAQTLDLVAYPSWRYGADRLDVRLADPRTGYPLPWPAQDPMRRPEGWGGGLPWQGSWSPQQIAVLAELLHQKSMLMHLDLDPPLVETADARARVAGLRFLMRTLGDVRHLATNGTVAPVDGITLRDPILDPSGAVPNLLRVFQPELSILSEDPEGAPMPGAVGLLDARRGQPAGLPAAGLSAQWRDRFVYERFPQGLLDARGRPPLEDMWGRGIDTGGTWPDWLIVQVQDFVRPRRGRAVVRWRGDLAQSELFAIPSVADYVHGLGLDPLRAACAYRLTATGRGGWRDGLRVLHGEPIQEGFGAETFLAAATPVLQNNHVRLHGTGGPLWFDPGALALWRGVESSGTSGSGRTLVLANRFVTTEVRPGRPQSDSIEDLAAPTIDLRGPISRGSGGYKERTLRLVGAELGLPRFPAMLERAALPTWPQRVEVSLVPPIGGMALELDVVGRDGSGLLVVFDDGEPVGVVPFDESSSTTRHRIPIGVARLELRPKIDFDVDSKTLAFEVMTSTGRVEIEAARLVPVSPGSGAEVDLVERCGYRAVIRERVASRYLRESSRFAMHVDVPGFVWTIDVEHASRGVQVLRSFGVRQNRLRKTTRGEENPAVRLKLPFRLDSTDANLPDLAVVPLSLSRDAAFELQNGRLVFKHYPATNQRLVLGFMVMAGSWRDASLAECAAVLRQLEEPRRVLVSAEGRARDVIDQGKRAVTHVVRVTRAVPDGESVSEPSAPRTPWFVEERGAWWFRGAQDAPDGGQWLRVHELPGHKTRIAPFDSPDMTFVPAAGSLYRLGIRDPREASCEVELVSPVARLMTPPPAVVAHAPFDSVRIDGVPWFAFDPTTRRIQLPLRRRPIRVEIERNNRNPVPAVWRCNAPLRACRYDVANRTLTIETVTSDGDYMAVVSGPSPTDVVNGRVVSDAATGPVPTAHRRAEAFVLRFRGGVTTLEFARPSTAGEAR